MEKKKKNRTEEKLGAVMGAMAETAVDVERREERREEKREIEGMGVAFGEMGLEDREKEGEKGGKWEEKLVAFARGALVGEGLDEKMSD